MSNKDSLGDLLKGLEKVEAGRKADPYLPLMARIDGKGFSKFTQGLNRPFDERFTRLIQKTTKFLVEQTDANLGYCQSDEISLYWYLDKENFSNREYWFGGKYQKMTSVLASMAGSFFCGNLSEYMPEKVGKYPAFDARVWNVPDLEHVHKNFLWRFRDAQKNSVSMYAREFFSHKSLQNKTCNEMKVMLREMGKTWEDLPSFFRNGTFVKRQTVIVEPEFLTDVPEQYRPTEPVLRTVVNAWAASDEFPYDLFEPNANRL